jgi:TonB family protein
MAKTSAPNSGGSQFYIVITKPASFLDGRYTVFGKVLEGQTVAEKIIVGDRMVKVTVSELGKAEFPTAIPAPAMAPAKMVRMVVPRLPDVTLKQQDKSSLRVKFTIEADGKFTSELLEKSGNDKVDQAVRDALIRWQWEPATKDGKPVKSEIEITIELPLRQMR